MQGSQQNLSLWWLNALWVRPGASISPRAPLHVSFYRTVMYPLQNDNGKRVSLSVSSITHSKLVVGIYRSFPHRSGVVETLHIVGLVEAGGGVR